MSERKRMLPEMPLRDERAGAMMTPGMLPTGRSVAADVGVNAAERKRAENDRRALEAQEMAKDGAQAREGVIGKKELDRAREILNRYRTGKTNLDKRVIENEKWWRLQHIPYTRKKINRETDTPSGWLFNSIANKHADAMDNYPSPSVLPREAGDRRDAEILSSVLPVILEQNHFEEVYDDAWRYKLKSGTAVYGVFWNNRKLNGLGDVDIRRVDVLNLFWEPRIEDIQDSKNLFYVYTEDNETLEGMYPQLKGKLGAREYNVVEYAYDDTDPEQDKSSVIDWYYKKWVNGAPVLHYCKFVGDVVLYATENEEAWRERGIYDHGMYPFVMDVMFRAEGSPAGFGYIDVMKGVQTRIDQIQNAITENSLETISNRYFIRDAASINEKEFMDHSNKLVHVSGELTDDNVRHIDVPDINGNYITILDSYINELKETSGNRDVNSGGGQSGVTAASAIAALQEAGSKLSRDMIKASYRSFTKICELVLENIRQFYTEERTFRITGTDGKEQFVQFSNQRIAPQVKEGMFGLQESRKPVFDVVVKAQKASPYTRISQNELAKEFYGMGFFDPRNADVALSCLNMMDFEGKQEIVQNIEKNGTMFQKLQQLQLLAGQMAMQLDREHGTQITQQLAAGGLIDMQGMAQQGMQAMPQGGTQGSEVATDSLGNLKNMNTMVERKRMEAQERSAPR